MKAATATNDGDKIRDAISIHAAREGGDDTGGSSTGHALISIHAAREGGDAAGRNGLLHKFYFNPRRP